MVAGNIYSLVGGLLIKDFMNSFVMPVVLSLADFYIHFM
jgi:hypothetical protein